MHQLIGRHTVYDTIGHIMSCSVTAYNVSIKEVYFYAVGIYLEL
jgi:hypothetical protein